ncbi:MAG: hypothetical protein SOZ62_07045 [Eubacteriales bacterium]|nr:hypothetical protein [Eubacteriales bacterium]
MKKSRIALCLVAMLVLVTILLSSCGASETIKVKKIFDNDAEPERNDVVSTGEAVSLSGNQDENNNYFCKFVDTTGENKVTYVYSFITGKTMLTLTDNGLTKQYDVEFINNLPVLTVTETTVDTSGTKTTYTLYDAIGESIASTQDSSETFMRINNSFFKFNGGVYTADEEEGTLTKVADYVSYMKYPEYNYKIGDCYYVLDESSGGVESVTVYDKDFNIIFTYYTPSYATYADAWVLNNGNLLVQYLVKQPDETEKYDIFDETSSKKYDINVIVVDIKNGKQTKTDFDGYIYDVISREEETEKIWFEGLDSDIENMVHYCPINDHRIEQSDAERKYASLTNKGKIDFSLKVVEGALDLPEKVAENRWVVYTTSGYSIINEKSEVLKTITNINNVEFVGSYILTQEGIFDMDFNLLKSLKDSDSASYTATPIGNSIIVCEDGKTTSVYTLYNNGNTTVIATSSDTSNENVYVEDNYYVVAKTVDGITTYTYYNADGAKLFDTKISLSEFSTYGTTTLLSGYDSANSKMVYYSIHK